MKSLRTQNESLFGVDFWSRDIIEPLFFEIEQEVDITANGDRYRAMLNEFMFQKIEEVDISNIWLQKDGAACHTAEEDTLYVLCTAFEDLIISRRADVVWQRGLLLVGCHQR